MSYIVQQNMLLHPVAAHSFDDMNVSCDNTVQIFNSYSALTITSITHILTQKHNLYSPSIFCAMMYLEWY